jgi:hypothetical protein
MDSGPIVHRQTLDLQNAKLGLMSFRFYCYFLNRFNQPVSSVCPLSPALAVSARVNTGFQFHIQLSLCPNIAAPLLRVRPSF